MSIDHKEPKLRITDSRGFAVEYGGTGQCFDDEEILRKLAHMRDAFRDMGLVAEVTLHIVAPQPLSITQRLLILCELWFECEGTPTQEQWDIACEDMWKSSQYIAQERGEPPPVKPDFPPLPVRSLKGRASHLRSVDPVTVDTSAAKLEIRPGKAGLFFREEDDK